MCAVGSLGGRKANRPASGKLSAGRAYNAHGVFIPVTANMADIIRAMRKAGADAETITRTIEVLSDDKAADRRKADRERQRAYRQSKSLEINNTVTPVTCDNGDKEKTPHTPQKKYPLYPPKGGSFPQTDSQPDDVDLLAKIGPAFEQFWEAYPKGTNRGGKRPALSQFLRTVKAGKDPNHLIAAARAYAKSLRDPQFCHAAHRWLAEEHWENVAGFAPAAPADPASTSLEQWRGYVGYFYRHSSWHGPGPDPKHPDCQAPAEALAEFGYRKLEPLLTDHGE